MSVSSVTVPQRPGSLEYELLLRKSDEVCCSGGKLSASSSTAEPDSLSMAETASKSCSALEILRATGAAPAKDSVTMLRNVSIHGPHEDERLPELICQARALSLEAFDEDSLQEVTKRSGWRLSLLALKDLSAVCGFIIARITTHGALAIKKLAVSSELRGLGLGKLIMEDVTKAAKKQGDVYEIRLSSLATAVTFYQHLGFKAFKGMKFDFDTDREFIEGQVYMEKKLRPRRK